MDEATFLPLLRAFATHPAARGLTDDAAILALGETNLVLTHDIIAEGIHYLATAPPEDVAWKLLAVNLSDLAAKGATPIGVLLGYVLGDDAWDRAFITGLATALDHFQVPLLGGDTIRAGTRVLGLTALGTSRHAPARSGARAGDGLFVTGAIGDAGLGLAIARSERTGPERLLTAYRRPQPLLAEGQALAPHVRAMMDVSDGLLIDAQRMADASGLALEIDLGAVPLSPAYVATLGNTRAARLAAAASGDDYALLFAGPVAATWPVSCCLIGCFGGGRGLTLRDATGPIPLPPSLGYQH